MPSFIFSVYLLFIPVVIGFLWPDVYGRQLQVQYGSQRVTPGMSLDIRDKRITTHVNQETLVIPEIGTNELHCKEKYILFFIDLDAILPGTKIQSVILHWYQSNLGLDCTNPHHHRLIIPREGHEGNDHPAASYIAPRPPPNTHHRYVFLLFAQRYEYRFPNCFAHVFPETVDARAGFDIRKFMQAAGLDPPLAMNYFFGRHEPADGDPKTMPPNATTTSFRFVNCPSTTSLTHLAG
ncbi:hypothetical protein N7452_002371 [Penicillium brevicompactum]|uniref:Phosphatidylethanolamine-binding protein n=1 Tax=Penicillium brevicompactum TaxID=5074 RepID=A0A9W9UQD1_PENBR|nr:hypothetical protein N7452_002371 [Penicillium brevicompactum]